MIYPGPLRFHMGPDQAPSRPPAESASANDRPTNSIDCIDFPSMPARLPRISVCPPAQAASIPQVRPLPTTIGTSKSPSSRRATLWLPLTHPLAPPDSPIAPPCIARLLSRSASISSSWNLSDLPLRWSRFHRPSRQAPQRLPGKRRGLACSPSSGRNAPHTQGTPPPISSPSHCPPHPLSSQILIMSRSHIRPVSLSAAGGEGGKEEGGAA
jgi:hypothetical protein